MLELASGYLPKGTFGNPIKTIKRKNKRNDNNTRFTWFGQLTFTYTNKRGANHYNKRDYYKCLRKMFLGHKTLENIKQEKPQL